MTRILEMPGADAPTLWRMRAIEAAGGLHYWTADVLGADALYRSQLELAQTLGDTQGTADAMFNLGHTQFLLDRDHTAADQLADEAIRLHQQVGDERSIARVAWTRANRRLEQGHSGVEPQMLEVLQRFEELGDDWYVALAQGSLGWAAFARGDLAGALRWGLAAIGGHHAMGDIASTTIVLRGLAIVFLDSGMPEEAATVHGAFESLCQRYGVQPPAFFEELGPDVRGRREIDLDRYPDAVARGASMSLEEAVDYVVSVARERLARPF